MISCQAKSICADGRPYILEPSVNKGNLDLFHFYDSWYTKWCWWKFMVRLSNFYDFSKKTQFAWMLWFLRNRQFIRILRFLQFPRFPRFPGWNTLVTQFSYVLVFTKCQILSHSCQMWLSGVWKGVVVSWCYVLAKFWETFKLFWQNVFDRKVHHSVAASSWCWFSH